MNKKVKFVGIALLLMFTLALTGCGENNNEEVYVSDISRYEEIQDDETLTEEEIIRHNQQYERYFESEIEGAELATLINRAMDNNRRNSVEQDTNGYFTDNGTNSINIDIEMITIEETFRMETIYNARNNRICTSV